MAQQTTPVCEIVYLGDYTPAFTVAPSYDSWANNIECDSEEHCLWVRGEITRDRRFQEMIALYRHYGWSDSGSSAHDVLASVQIGYYVGSKQALDIFKECTKAQVDILREFQRSAGYQYMDTSQQMAVNYMMAQCFSKQAKAQYDIGQLESKHCFGMPGRN
jgi:hypothetical protein